MVRLGVHDHQNRRSRSPEYAFIAIESIDQLIDEGETMHHCVITRAPDILAGNCAIYRVNVAGQRGTLEVRLGKNGSPLNIEEFRLACNEEPSRDAWIAARVWLSNAQKNLSGLL